MSLLKDIVITAALFAGVSALYVQSDDLRNNDLDILYNNLKSKQVPALESKVDNSVSSVKQFFAKISDNFQKSDEDVVLYDDKSQDAYLINRNPDGWVEVKVFGGTNFTMCSEYVGMRNFNIEGNINVDEVSINSGRVEKVAQVLGDYSYNSRFHSDGAEIVCSTLENIAERNLKPYFENRNTRY